MSENRIHVIKDENLGGILREYVEVDRKAEVGEYIFTINTKEIHKVTKGSEDGVYIDGWVYVYDGYYRTLEPTDIVRLREENGTERRYRLVARKAKVGEKVIVTDNGCGYPIGTITKCEFSGCDIQISNGSRGIKHEHYRVLEPLHTCDKCGKPLGETACSNQKGGSYCAKADDETEASKSVLDLLANLAQRIAKLECEFNEMEKALSSNQTRASRAEKKADLMQDEIDTLHRNIETWAQEIERTKADVVTLDERTQPLVAIVKAVKSGE